MSDLDQMIDKLAGELMPVRPVNPAIGQLLFAAVAVGTLLLAMIVWGLSAPMGALRPSQVAVLSCGLFFLLGVAGGWALTRMARPRIGRSSNGWRWTAVAVALLPVSAVLLTLFAGAPWTGASWSEGIGCLVRGLIASIAMATALTLWLRRGAPLRIHTAAWLVGLTSGAVGALAVALTCPEQSLSHIGVWHAGIIATAAVIGRITLPSALRW